MALNVARAKLVDWIGSTRLSRIAGTVLLPRFCFATIMDRQQGFGPHCTLSFDCDFPRDVEVLPDLVRILDRYGVTSSFACVGQWVREYPAEHRMLVAAGHELINHTETHPNLYHSGYDYASAPDLNRRRFNQLDVDERRREVFGCHGTFQEILEYSPVGFRTPHFGELHVEDVYGLLAELGYRFSSSVMSANRGGVPYRTEAGIWEFPVSPCPDHPFGVLDSWHALGKVDAKHARPGQLAGLFQFVLQTIQVSGGYLNAYLDPRVCVDSGELERILRALIDSRVPVRTYGALLESIA